MALLQGQTVTLIDLVQSGVDAFNAPVFQENPVAVDNVLICPTSTEAIAGEAIAGSLELWGKRVVNELLIPKGDTHSWEDREVEFLGHRWKTFGFVLQWPEHLTPGSWNKKVKVERYE